MIIDLITTTDATGLLAYLDPGLGSLQFQMLVAGLLSVGFFLKSNLIHFKHQLNRFLKRDA